MAGGFEAGKPVLEVDLSHVPLRPTSAKEVRELEIALIVATIFREDVIREILSPREFTTWLDSLTVAAGALAREKAGYTITKIADELGRSEATIRNHLQGKTKAGQLVRDTYQKLVRGKITLIAIGKAQPQLEEKLREIESSLTKMKESIENAMSLLGEAEKALENALRKLSS